MKKILVINLGWEQEPLIDRIFDLSSFEVYGIHYNQFAYRKEDFCNVHICDLRDIKSILNYCETIQFDAVISDQCDFSLFVQAMIAEKYGLPGPSLKSAQISNNKYLQRTLLESSKVKSPAFSLCLDLNDAKEFCNKKQFPVIMKPVDSRGSFGVTKINSLEELSEAFFHAMENSFSRQVIIEEFINGIHVTVDGYCFNNVGQKSLSLATKELIDSGLQISMGINYPGKLEDSLFSKILVANEDCNRCLGYKFGMLHSEYMISGDDVYLIESTNRGGGAGTSEIIVPATSGIDLIDQYIADCIGRNTCNYKQPEHNPVVLNFFQFSAGKVKSIEGIKKLETDPRVLKLRLAFKAGDILNPITSDADRHGFIIFSGTSEEAYQLMKEVTVEYS